jgi:hypothetical protein
VPLDINQPEQVAAFILERFIGQQQWSNLS